LRPLKGNHVLTLVRHAHAGEKKNWTKPDADRPLSQRGWQQAAGLAQSLSVAPGASLICSPLLRCHQTLVPLATRLRRPIEHERLLAPDADAARLARALRDPRFDGAVVCTHGETLNALMDVWADRLVLEDSAGRAAAGAGTTEKGAAWIIVDEGARKHAHYLRPLLIGAAIESEAWSQTTSTP
jgi:phosphohistidine phosphatase SixA